MARLGGDGRPAEQAVSVTMVPAVVSQLVGRYRTRTPPCTRLASPPAGVAVLPLSQPPPSFQGVGLNMRIYLVFIKLIPFSCQHLGYIFA